MSKKKSIPKAGGRSSAASGENSQSDSPNSAGSGNRPSPAGSFNNPFEALSRRLDTTGQAGGKTAAQKNPPGSSAAARPAAAVKAAAGQAAPARLEADEAALFLRAVNNPGFRPLKDESGGKKSGGVTRPAQFSKPAEPPEDLSMAELMAELAAGRTSPAGNPALPLRGGNVPGAAADAGGGPADLAPARQGVSEVEGAGALRRRVISADLTSGRSGAGRAEGEPPDGALKEEENLFIQAMQGVNPVDGKGRDLPLRIKPEKPQPELAPDYLENFLQGKFEFALEYTEEWFEGHVMGVDPLLIAKLRAGQYSPEAHVDLHGQNAEQAYASLVDFIRQAYNKGQRSLVVVTGRGKNSPGGLSILRERMQDWLTQDPLKRVVLAFCTAQPKDGGAGALYVMLRKFKKSKGKIRWDRGHWDGVSLL